jgi:hypothetical protein
MGALETGFLLDARWHWLRSEMEQSKRPDLLLVARTLDTAGCRYAIIGGVALQIHQREPRTTLDIDLAVASRADLPRAALEAAGFRPTGEHAHSDNWVGPGGTPVQITDDPALRPALARAVAVALEDVTLQVLAAPDLLHEKLRACRDPARRRSKRLQDLADAQSLLEQHPALEADLTPDERALLAAAP